ncbi:MAG: hypothetical protein V3U39_00745, partial [Acidimicrobiia bacterium]
MKVILVVPHLTRLRGTAEFQLGIAMTGPGTAELQLGIAMPNPGTAELQLGIAMADPGTAELQLGIAMADPGTAELQLGIAMADPGTAELQLGIHARRQPSRPGASNGNAPTQRVPPMNRTQKGAQKGARPATPLLSALLITE